MWPTRVLVEKFWLWNRMDERGNLWAIYFDSSDILKSPIMSNHLKDD